MIRELRISCNTPDGVCQGTLQVGISDAPHLEQAVKSLANPLHSHFLDDLRVLVGCKTQLQAESSSCPTIVNILSRERPLTLRRASGKHEATAAVLSGHTGVRR